MRILILILLLGFVQKIEAQVNISDVINAGKQISDGRKYSLDKNWFSNVELEFLIPSKVRYNHFFKSNNQTTFTEEELKRNPSFGLTYSINYPVFNKLSLGAVTSFEHQTTYNITALKFGGKINYFFTNYENATMYLMILHNTFSSKSNKEMGNVRLGLAFPITEMEEKDISLNLFLDHDFYRLNEPLLQNEVPDSITITSYGVSIGIQF